MGALLGTVALTRPQTEHPEFLGPGGPDDPERDEPATEVETERDRYAVAALVVRRMWIRTTVPCGPDRSSTRSLS